MKQYRCIKCELVWDQEEFTDKQICKICERNVVNNNERRRYWGIFCHYAQEVFYIRYPEPNHSWVTIPSDDEGKCKIIEKAERNLVIGINSRTADKEKMERDNNTSTQSYKDTLADLAQMEQLVPLIVNLENRYCKK